MIPKAKHLHPILCFLFYVLPADKMFVTEADNAEILMAEAIDYSFVNTTFIKLPLNGLVFPVGVEFDPRSEMIYWTDALLHTVNRANLDGSWQGVIAQLASGPRELHCKLIYWISRFMCIQNRVFEAMECLWSVDFMFSVFRQGHSYGGGGGTCSP